MLRMYHAVVGRTRRCMCTCHVQRMRVSHMRAWCWPAPRSHARPHAAWSSRLGPQQALASAGLGFERRLSAAVLDRACPDWKRPHSQATAWCMARCMARRSQGARGTKGKGGALEVPWVSQLVGTARVRVKRVAAGGTHRSREGTWPTPVHLTCARRVVDPTCPRPLTGEHAGRECRGRGALLSPLPVPSARGDERRATIQPPTLSTPPSMHSALSRPYSPPLVYPTARLHLTPLPSPAPHPLRPSRRTPPRCYSYAARRICTRGAM